MASNPLLTIQSTLAIRNSLIRNKLVLRNISRDQFAIYLIKIFKELLALRNNFRATIKFLIAKFDSTRLFLHLPNKLC